MVIWLIGLSGAGKTTLGELLVARLRESHNNVVFLDGDILRDVWNDKLGYDISGRYTNAHRISHLSKMLDSQGIIVVAAVLSLFPEWQAWNRKKFSRYYEVFLDVPMEVLQQRDTKGLYAAAVSGEMENVVGVDIPFPQPEHADMTIGGADWSKKPMELADEIFCNIEVLFNE